MQLNTRVCLCVPLRVAPAHLAALPCQELRALSPSEGPEAGDSPPSD